jgi:type I restriction enzyme S subunit
MTDLKPGWQRVKFGEVVRLNKETCKDPEAAGINRVIGLEHLEPGDLRVRSWADVADGTTFSNRVRPGQVLFGKRRAYQRKVAVADFDAICSGDIYVFETADQTQLLQELLPYICQTESFFEYAVGTSAGSLSPRTNWKSLASYEFVLPTLKEQRRIVDLLLLAASTAESLCNAAACSNVVFRSFLSKHMSGETASNAINQHESLTQQGECRLTVLDKIAVVERGMFSHRPRNLPEFFGGPYPFAQTGDVAASRGYLGLASQSLSELGRTYSKSFPPESILITIAAVIGATAITQVETYCPDSVVGIIPDHKQVDVRFLEYKLRHLRPYLDAQEATQTAQKNINLQVLRPLPIALPSLEVQRNLVARLTAIEQQSIDLHARASSVSNLAKQVLAEFDIL